MTNFQEISVAPPAWVLPSNVLTPERLDASYYEPRYLRAAAQLEALPCKIKDFRQICIKLNCGATPKLVKYGDGGVPLIRTSNVRPNLYDATDTLRVPGFSIQRESNVAILPEDVLYTMSGSVGYAAVYPENGEIASCSNTIARGRIEAVSDSDPYYVAAFLNSSIGKLQSDRLVSGGVLGHVMPNSVKRLRVALPSADVQRAIGNMLRKAERLKVIAETEMQTATTLLTDGLVLGQMRIPEGNFSWCAVGEFGPARLDASYYQPKYLSMVEHFALLRQKGVSSNLLSELLHDGAYGVLPPSDSYGTGDLPFVRAEALGRFTLDTADPIHVPREYANPKALGRRGELLIEVKGQIQGGALCPSEADGWLLNGSIYRMRLHSDIPAGYVLAVLLSPIGTLQKQRAAANSIISYLSLEFLEKLLIPRLRPEIEDRIDRAIRLYSETIAESKRLTQTAVAAVEALIHDRLDEALIAEGEAIAEWLKRNPSSYRERSSKSNAPYF